MVGEISLKSIAFNLCFQAIYLNTIYLINIWLENTSRRQTYNICLKIDVVQH